MNSAYRLFRLGNRPFILDCSAFSAPQDMPGPAVHHAIKARLLFPSDEQNLSNALFVLTLLSFLAMIRKTPGKTELRESVSIDEKLVNEIVGRILAVASPKRIILFGSASTGGMTRDSDIDLLIVEDSPGNVREESVRLRDTLRGLGYPFDVIVMPTERFEETKSIIGGIAYPANKSGKVIYEAA
jgi:predicted nucleotidyltransferase